MQQLAQAFETTPGDAMLALMMLAHGTRIGETRMARWNEISLLRPSGSSPRPTPRPAPSTACR